MCMRLLRYWIVFFQAEDGIRDLGRFRGLGDVYKRQVAEWLVAAVLAVEEARGAVVLPDGSPWKIEPEPLVYQGVANSEVADRLDLRLFDPRGQPAPLAKRRTNPPAVPYTHLTRPPEAPG